MATQKMCEAVVPNYKRVMITHVIRIVLKFKQMLKETCLESEIMSGRPSNCKGALVFLHTDIVV